jgi:hypothetical protein
VLLKYQKSSIKKDQVTQEVNQKINSKVYHELKQFESGYIPDVTRIVHDIEQGKYIILYKANIKLLSGATQLESTNFEQVWNHNDAKDQEK